MADAGAPQAESGVLRQVKGFPDICGDYLRFPFEVPDEVKCEHCRCIPTFIFPLLCNKHGLCFDCKIECEGYYCPICDVNTTPEQLRNMPSCLNSGVETLWVLCYLCGKLTQLSSLEEHLLKDHEADVCETELKHLEATSDVTPMEVDETGSSAKQSGNYDSAHGVNSDINGSCKPPPVSSVVVETNLISQRNQHSVLVYQCPFCKENIAKNNRAKHLQLCPKYMRKCLDCGDRLFNAELEHHKREECPMRSVRCDACSSQVELQQLEIHMSQCPKTDMKCPGCGNTVRREDLGNHMKRECRKRIAYCKACGNAMAFDELSEHVMTCKEWPVKCVSCDWVTERKYIAEHLFKSCSKEKHGIRRELCDDSYNYSTKEHISQCPKTAKRCPDCGVTDFKEDLDLHQKMNCQKRAVRCEACYSALYFDELHEHAKVCEDMKVPCEDCKDMVLRKELSKHASETCSNRVIYCRACEEPYPYSGEKEHNKVCEEMEVTCEDCEGMVLRKELPKHVSESCLMRVIYCEACEEPYTYAKEEDHQKQCAMSTIPCNYCKVELKASEDENEHLEVCEDFPVECHFRRYGCKEKGPRKEMQEHNKDPHNELLHEVIDDLQKRIENLERPLSDLVGRLRASARPMQNNQ